MIYAIMFCVLVLVDQLSKLLVFALYDKGSTVTFFLGHVFGIEKTTNDGIAFGWLSEFAWAQPLVIVLTFAASAVLVYFLCKLSPKRRFLRWALLLILAGAVGNLIDRIALQEVRDFLYMNFGLGSYTEFTNNVADLEITIGAVMFIIALLFVDSEAVFRHGEKKEEAEVSEALELLNGKGIGSLNDPDDSGKSVAPPEPKRPEPPEGAGESDAGEDAPSADPNDA